MQILISNLPLLIARLGRQHNHTRWPLRAPRGAQLRSTRHIHVRDIVILAQHRDVRDDVHGADVGGQNDDAVGDVIAVGAR